MATTATAAAGRSARVDPEGLGRGVGGWADEPPPAVGGVPRTGSPEAAARQRRFRGARRPAAYTEDTPSGVRPRNDGRGGGGGVWGQDAQTIGVQRQPKDARRGEWEGEGGGVGRVSAAAHAATVLPATVQPVAVLPAAVLPAVVPPVAVAAPPSRCTGTASGPRPHTAARRVRSPPSAAPPVGGRPPASPTSGGASVVRRGGWRRPPAGGSRRDTLTRPRRAGGGDDGRRRWQRQVGGTTERRVVGCAAGRGGERVAVRVPTAVVPPLLRAVPPPPSTGHGHRREQRAEGRWRVGQRGVLHDAGRRGCQNGGRAAGGGGGTGCPRTGGGRRGGGRGRRGDQPDRAGGTRGGG